MRGAEELCWLSDPLGITSLEVPLLLLYRPQEIVVFGTDLFVGEKDAIWLF